MFAVALSLNQAHTWLHGKQLQELFWGAVPCSWTLVVCTGLVLNYWKPAKLLTNLFYNSLLNIFFAETATPSFAQPAQTTCKKTTSYQPHGRLVVFEVTFKAHLSKRSSLCLSSPGNRRKSSLVSLCGGSISSLSLASIHDFIFFLFLLPYAPPFQGRN